MGEVAVQRAQFVFTWGLSMIGFQLLKVETIPTKQMCASMQFYSTHR